MRRTQRADGAVTVPSRAPLQGCVFCRGGWPTLDPPARCLRRWATAPGGPVPCRGCTALPPCPCRRHPASTHLTRCRQRLCKANPPGFIALLCQTLGVTSILSTRAVETGGTALVRPGARVQKAPSVPAPRWQEAPQILARFRYEGVCKAPTARGGCPKYVFAWEAAGTSVFANTIFAAFVYSRWSQTNAWLCEKSITYPGKKN